jgi:hypothetical protein
LAFLCAEYAPNMHVFRSSATATDKHFLFRDYPCALAAAASSNNDKKFN